MILWFFLVAGCVSFASTKFSYSCKWGLATMSSPPIESLTPPVSSNAVESDPLLLELSAAVPPEIQAELDELIARADTFINELEASDAPAYFVKPVAPKYIQGVVQGEQAHLNTNLMDGRSVKLVQQDMIWTMGRNREVGISIKDKIMSRRHASIMYLPVERAFYLLDLNSMNGSYVNGLPVKAAQRLADGDFLRVGNTEFFFFRSDHQETLEPLHPEVYKKLVSAVDEEA